MAGFLKAIQTAGWKILDPGRDARLNDWSRSCTELMLRRRESFDVAVAMREIGVDREDEELVRQKAYASFVQKAWEDGDLSDRERKALKWAERSLHVLPSVAAVIERDHIIDKLRATAASCNKDNIADTASSMARMAVQASQELAHLGRNHLRKEIEDLMPMLFARFLETQGDAHVAWSEAQRIAGILGRTEEEFSASVRIHAERTIRDIVEFIRKRGEVPSRERALIETLLSHVPFSNQFAAEVAASVNRVHIIHRIRQGQLPSVPCNDVGLRAGEVVHLRERGEYCCVKTRRDGTTDWVSYPGDLKITDYRLIFVGSTSAHEYRHSAVVDLSLGRQGIEVRTQSNELSVYRFYDNNLAFEIFKAAIGKANHTVVDRSYESIARSIPQDVRQRVWQKYGGRCAECGAQEYLEFDHIIPVAKGGGNSEQNIQLLCRRCNGRKSDRI